MAQAQRSVLKEGIVAGLIGASVVAMWFLLLDVARGRPLFTPGLLGAAVFQGLTDPSTLRITAGPVLGYTILHGLAFIAFGVVAASIMAVSEREPALFVGFVILFACFEVFFFGVVGALGQSMPTAAVFSYTVVHGLAFIVVGVLGSLLIAGAERQPLFVFALVIFFTAFEVFFFGAVVILAKWVLDALAGWTVFVGNLLAAAGMLGYFFAGHRGLARRLTAAWADED